jgi:hypothetical protein
MSRIGIVTRGQTHEWQSATMRIVPIATEPHARHTTIRALASGHPVCEPRPVAMFDLHVDDGIRTTDMVDALVRSGFSVYRRDSAGTILERGVRAVVVPTRERLSWFDIAALRRMAGIPHAEMLALLRRR